MYLVAIEQIIPNQNHQPTCESNVACFVGWVGLEASGLQCAVNTALFDLWCKRHESGPFVSTSTPQGLLTLYRGCSVCWFNWTQVVDSPRDYGCLATKAVIHYTQLYCSAFCLQCNLLVAHFFAYFRITTIWNMNAINVTYTLTHTHISHTHCTLTALFACKTWALPQWLRARR
jgi:hypothetical protein